MYICDKKPATITLALTEYPETIVVDEEDVIMNDTSIDAVGRLHFCLRTYGQRPNPQLLC